MDPRLAKTFSQRVLNVDVIDRIDNRLMLGYRTTNSGMTLGLAVDHIVETENDYRTEVEDSADEGKLVLTVHAQPGVPVRITKFASFHTSRSVVPAELVDRAVRSLDRAVRDGFDQMLVEQRRQLDRFWKYADVRVDTDSDGNGAVQQAVRWNLFQLAQATWRAEGSGYTGQGFDRAGVRGALLLGHGGVRAAVPGVHTVTYRQKPAAISLFDA